MVKYKWVRLIVANTPGKPGALKVRIVTNTKFALRTNGNLYRVSMNNADTVKQTLSIEIFGGNSGWSNLEYFADAPSSETEALKKAVTYLFAVHNERVVNVILYNEVEVLDACDKETFLERSGLDQHVDVTLKMVEDEAEVTY